MNIDKIKQEKTLSEKDKSLSLIDFAKTKSIKELLEFGILNIDKPADMTSFDVSDFIRRKLKLRKTSHFGTLDPMVTGVLPIALNRGVKLTGFFLGEDKEYEGTMRIHKDISLEEIRKAISEKFTGKIIQKPPIKSRVKRQEREREIKLFQLLEKKGKDITFKTEVQGGTYIRKLISDLGEYMGINMHMIALRRIRAGIFKVKDSIPLADIESFDEKTLKGKIIPAEIVSEVYEPVEIKKEVAPKVLHGKPLFYEDLKENKKFETRKIISVFSENKFIGMFKVVNEGDTFAKPEFVFQ
jgi:H/ACA ribonucleoprotein complex subunit 4